MAYIMAMVFFVASVFFAPMLMKCFVEFTMMDSKAGKVGLIMTNNERTFVLEPIEIVSI